MNIDPRLLPFIKPVLNQIGLVVILSVVSYLRIGSWWSVVWLIVGGVIGLAMLRADELYLLPNYRKNETDTKLITRSPLFLMVFALLALFVLTSSDQYVGFGVIFGISIGLLVEGWSLTSRPAEFASRFATHASPKHAEMDATQGIESMVSSAQTTTTALQIMTGATLYAVLLLGWWLFGR